MADKNKVVLEKTPDMQIASIRFKGSYSKVKDGKALLRSVAGERAVGPVFALYYDKAYVEDGADIEACIEVTEPVEGDGVKTRMLEAALCASMVHYGPYSNMHETYEAIESYIEKNGLKRVIPSREVYIAKQETLVMLPVE